MRGYDNSSAWGDIAPTLGKWYDKTVQGASDAMSAIGPAYNQRGADKVNTYGGMDFNKPTSLNASAGAGGGGANIMSGSNSAATNGANPTSVTAGANANTNPVSQAAMGGNSSALNLNSLGGSQPNTSPYPQSSNLAMSPILSGSGVSPMEGFSSQPNSVMGNLGNTPTAATPDFDAYKSSLNGMGQPAQPVLGPVPGPVRQSQPAERGNYNDQNTPQYRGGTGNTYDPTGAKLRQAQEVQAGREKYIKNSLAGMYNMGGAGPTISGGIGGGFQSGNGYKPIHPSGKGLGTRRLEAQQYGGQGGLSKADQVRANTANMLSKLAIAPTKY